MTHPTKQKVASITGDGHVRLMVRDLPPLKEGTLLVEVHASLVSPGTELDGWHSLKQKRENPGRDDEEKPFGYSNSGIVLDVGEGVEKFKKGDRVACIGWGFALHADYTVMPQNLCIKLPDTVSFLQGSYAMLAATALNTLRRGRPEFGESAAIVGLGLVGQLTAQLYKLAGNFVIGWDRIRHRLEIARKWGIDSTVLIGEEDEISNTMAFTDGYGLDSAVFAFGGNADAAYEKIWRCLKLTPDNHRLGRIVIVGSAKLNFSWDTGNVDILIAARTGPGYHDDEWEHGADYPPVFMRWTTQTNLALCIRLISEHKLDVENLTTHQIPLTRVDEETSKILEDPDRILGVAFIKG